MIISVLEKPDPRPVYIAINAGANTLAQALWDLRKTKSEEELNKLIAKIGVYDDLGQDDAGAWICHNFPNLFYVRSRKQIFALYGPKGSPGPYTWEPYEKTPRGQHAWVKEHIQVDHGPLGALYPKRFGGRGFLEGGGTTTWIGLINKGVYDPEHITWGGWGGRFEGEKRLNYPSRYQKDVAKQEKKYRPYYMYPEAADRWDGEEEEFTTDKREPLYNPIWRWRRAHMNEFRARMDWCVKEYCEANHNPAAAFNGDTGNEIMFLKAKPGEKIKLDASASSDPDGDDLNFKWFVYPEAGTYQADVIIPNDKSSITEVKIPKDAGEKQIHIILQITDNSDIVPLYDYRRIVINVTD